MGITLDEALQNEIISKNIIDLLPKKCKCGARLEFSDSLREIRCTNKKCKQHIIARLSKFVEKTNISLSAIDIEDIVEKLKIISPYQVLLLPIAFKEENSKVKLLNLHDKNNVLQDIENLTSKEYMLYEIIELCGIDNISKIAYKIFNNFDSIDEAYDEIETGQLSFINERLGIKNQDSSIISLEIYNLLLDLKDELIFAETLFKIKGDAREKLNIAFSDNIQPYINTAELLDILNQNKKFRFNHIVTINDKTDILVRNANSANSKFRAARIINDKHIAELMNKGELTLDEIGTFKNEFKPLGSKIYIDKLENIMKRIQEFIGE